MQECCSTVGMAESHWDQIVIHRGYSVTPSRNALVEAMNHTDIFSDGNGWHSEHLVFGSDEQPAQAAEKFGTIWDLFRAKNLLLFLFYEVDNVEFMACLVIICPKEGKWIGLFPWFSVFLHYIWSVLWHFVSDSALARHSSSQIYTITQTDVSGALPQNSLLVRNQDTTKQRKRKKLICGRNPLNLRILHFRNLSSKIIYYSN